VVNEFSGKTTEDVKEPVPFMAEIGGTEFDGALSLKLEWLDPMAVATGVYLVDETTKREIDFREVIEATRGSDAWNQGGFPVFFDAKTADAWKGIKAGRPPLSMSRDQIKGDLRVGLISKDGAKSRLIPVFIDLPKD
jgi:hypothetical protein